VQINATAHHWKKPFRAVRSLLSANTHCSACPVSIAAALQRRPSHRIPHRTDGRPARFFHPPLRWRHRATRGPRWGWFNMAVSSAWSWHF